MPPDERPFRVFCVFRGGFILSLVAALPRWVYPGSSMVKLFILHSAFRIPHLDDPFSPEISLYEQDHQTRPKTMKTKPIQTTGPRDYRNTGLNIAMKAPTHRTLLTLPTLLTLFTLLGPAPVSAQTWQTVDDLQYVFGKSSDAMGLAVDLAGNLFVGGNGSDANSHYHALIEKTSDGGLNWQTVDDFSPCYAFDSGGVACDPAGILYEAGRYIACDGNPYGWFTRQSLNGGTTWNTVDTVPPFGYAQGVASDAAGNVFVVGWRDITTIATTTNKNGTTTSTTNTTQVWLVRKGTNSGTSWANVDGSSAGSPRAVFCHPTQGIFVTGVSGGWTTRRSLDGGATWATVDTLSGGVGNALGADPSGNIYAVGSSGGGHWLVRKSSDGASWTTVDDFFPCVTISVHPLRTQCPSSAGANGFACDLQGNLFVVGRFTPSSGAQQWLVRENPGGAGTWQTVDTFQYSAGVTATAKAAAADASGHMYVAGVANDASGVNHWIVRKN